MSKSSKNTQSKAQSQGSSQASSQASSQLEVKDAQKPIENYTQYKTFLSKVGLKRQIHIDEGIEAAELTDFIVDDETEKWLRVKDPQGEFKGKKAYVISYKQEAIKKLIETIKKPKFILGSFPGTYKDGTAYTTVYAILLDEQIHKSEDGDVLGQFLELTVSDTLVDGNLQEYVNESSQYTGQLKTLLDCCQYDRLSIKYPYTTRSKQYRISCSYIYGMYKDENDYAIAPLDLMEYYHEFLEMNGYSIEVSTDMGDALVVKSLKITDKIANDLLQDNDITVKDPTLALNELMRLNELNELKSDENRTIDASILCYKKESLVKLNGKIPNLCMYSDGDYLFFLVVDTEFADYTTETLQRIKKTPTKLRERSQPPEIKGGTQASNDTSPLHESKPVPKPVPDVKPIKSINCISCRKYMNPQFNHTSEESKNLFDKLFAEFNKNIDKRMKIDYEKSIELLDEHKLLRYARIALAKAQERKYQQRYQPSGNSGFGSGFGSGFVGMDMVDGMGGFEGGSRKAKVKAASRSKRSKAARIVRKSLRRTQRRKPNTIFGSVRFRRGKA
jgi:hypothetical protein